MTSHEKRGRRLFGLLAGCAALSVALLGCGAEPEPEVVSKPPPRPKAPPPPSRPSFTPIEDLKAQLAIDERVDLPESDAPATDPDRIAVLTFFDAFARGDEVSLRKMMPPLEQEQLDALIEDGVWNDLSKNINEIQIKCGTSPFGEKCALAIYEVDHFNYDAQMWLYRGAGEYYSFEAMPSPPNVLNRLYGDDLIARWFEIRDQEIALASADEEGGQIPQIDISDLEADDDKSPGVIGGGGGAGSGGRRARRENPPPR
jgi:hypothetical protein